jgi:hypothetical protein
MIFASDAATLATTLFAGEEGHGQKAALTTPSLHVVVVVGRDHMGYPRSLDFLPS